VDLLEGMTEGTWEISEAGGVHSLRVAVAGKVIRFESGKMARLASGAVSVTSGQTNVFCAATLDRRNPPRPIDFTPLRVDYSERTSAAGRTPGGYIKRDGRPSDHETLVARLIDRPIRPLITAGWSLETQLAAYVFAYDGQTVPDVLGICAASAALALSEVPFPKPVAGVRVAQVHGKLVVNPTLAEQAVATLDLVVAGTKDAVMMVEGAASFVPEATVVEALELGLSAISVLATAIGEWRAAGAGLPVYAPGFLPPSSEVYGFLERFQVDGNPLPEAYRQAMIGGTKEQRERNCVDLQARVVGMLLGGGKPGAAEPRELVVESLAASGAILSGSEGEEEEEAEPTAAEGKGVEEVPAPASSFEEAEVRGALKRLACLTMRQIVEETGERTDGRATHEVRPINIEMSPLPPSVHGSVLFTRGETQSLGTTTLGDSSMAQRYENLQGEQNKRFYLQYAFPPFSVGEVGRIGSPGRREVGHGNLAERALRAAVPGKDEFPYVIRTESLITESCGSSSMASVCAGCLSMLAAGVPLSSMVAGVAMGLLLDETGSGGEPIILTDILGSEDALGTMDFKVWWTQPKNKNKMETQQRWMVPSHTRGRSFPCSHEGQ
jgi:polyribonucleotide nucleotidyltransferase